MFAFFSFLREAFFHFMYIIFALQPSPNFFRMGFLLWKPGCELAHTGDCPAGAPPTQATKFTGQNLHRLCISRDISITWMSPIWPALQPFFIFQLCAVTLVSFYVKIFIAFYSKVSLFFFPSILEQTKQPVVLVMILLHISMIKDGLYRRKYWVKSFLCHQPAGLCLSSVTK